MDELQVIVEKQKELANEAKFLSDEIRNAVLEEVAQEFDKMRFGNTSASFAAFVRGMKE
jgi:transcription elongation GreA/GreB family factor